MVFNITLIFGCQLAGETLVRLIDLPLPGPVVGMALLFAGLLLFGLPEGLAKTGDVLLGNLSLLFVPAGVGVMLHAGLLARNWPAISAGLVLSTLLTIAVTGLLMQRLGRHTDRDTDRDPQ
ncbi:MAG: CidA/LrgA family protein [Pseudomonadota bacterium]